MTTSLGLQTGQRLPLPPAIQAILGKIGTDRSPAERTVLVYDYYNVQPQDLSWDGSTSPTYINHSILISLLSCGSALKEWRRARADDLTI
jgi:hypothetical protein